MSDINTDVLDVDFSKCEQYTPGDRGVRRSFGLAPYEERFALLSDAEIEQAIDAHAEHGGSLDLLVSRIYDQGQEGACASNATAQAHEIVQAQQYGIDAVVHLSAISLYKRVRLQGGGSFIDDNWEELNSRGILPLDTPENREEFGDYCMPNVGKSLPFPSGWEGTGKLFAGLEATPINSVRGLKTAMLSHPVVVGRDGHAICYCRLMRDRGRHVAKYANSWNQRWGDNGFGYDSESKIASSARWAFALRSVRVER